MTGRPIGRSPARRPVTTSDLRSRLNAKCRWCPAAVMWLAHSITGDLAPIDARPAPGGNVLVDRTTAGKITGTYQVMSRAERGLFDANASDDEAAPLLHFNHWATCESSTARRLAAERSRARAGAATVAADGTPLRRPRGTETSPDRLGPPPEIASSVLSCPECAARLHPALIAAGEPRHPSCTWSTTEVAAVQAAVSQARERFHQQSPGRLTWGERFELT